ncbi:ADP-ribosylglycohydrolase family protein [Myceligenerans salitolerans]|uniref:ADP-ribosylglycohydrolase family protein n=1 Tax=Myceligenerans salitolerans TaxID=1230528 RepID=A0ABS3IA03_9MICO|nr:ADP-ribosylglycohydrolase family protein [Myceligenerans salitolerans]MBO0609859.1 ADP-ribosylglycohydrolase family protein [Myceligenerans salitolerans]
MPSWLTDRRRATSRDPCSPGFVTSPVTHGLLGPRRRTSETIRYVSRPHPTSSHREQRVSLCLDSLHGLSVGDALGAQYFVPDNDPARLLQDGVAPEGPWEWTDDTDMACTVAAELVQHGDIDRDRLALDFAHRCDPYRGYGAGAVQVLHQIRDGVPWQQATVAAFPTGSYGNGAAMRIAPLGAYFAGDLDRVAEQAIRASEVTHAHPEGIAGAVVTAVASSYVAQSRLVGVVPTPGGVLDAVGRYLLPGATAKGVAEALTLGEVSVEEAAWRLGNGSRVSAQDTVPFCLWAATTRLNDYPAAISACIEAGGDVDTTAAIVGGIVATFTGVGQRDNVIGVPEPWLSQREPLPDWMPPARGLSQGV